MTNTTTYLTSDVKRAASAIVDVTDEFPAPVALRALMVVAVAMNREDGKSPLPTFDELALVLKEVIEARDRGKL